jgi:hypothetical protein
MKLFGRTASHLSLGMTVLRHGRHRHVLGDPWHDALPESTSQKQWFVILGSLGQIIKERKRTVWKEAKGIIGLNCMFDASKTTGPADAANARLPSKTLKRFKYLI